MEQVTVCALVALSLSAELALWGAPWEAVQAHGERLPTFAQALEGCRLHSVIVGVTVVAGRRWIEALRVGFGTSREQRD